MSRYLLKAMQQDVRIDVRGQKLTPVLIDKIEQGISKKYDSIIKKVKIRFKKY